MISISVAGWTIWCLGVFVLGISAGSFLQVAAVRLPFEKSLLWPGSHCMNCLRPIAWHDNIPILGWLMLRGRCRNCRASYSVRYLLVELFAGLGFLGMFVMEVVLDVRGVGWWATYAFYLNSGLVPGEAWLIWSAEAVLFSLLLAASLCDLEHQEMPLALPGRGLGWGCQGCGKQPGRVAVSRQPSTLADAVAFTCLDAPRRLVDRVAEWPGWSPGWQPDLPGYPGCLRAW